MRLGSLYGLRLRTWGGASGWPTSPSSTSTGSRWLITNSAKGGSDVVTASYIHIVAAPTKDPRVQASRTILLSECSSAYRTIFCPVIGRESGNTFPPSRTFFLVYILAVQQQHLSLNASHALTLHSSKPCQAVQHLVPIVIRPIGHNLCINRLKNIYANYLVRLSTRALKYTYCTLRVDLGTKLTNMCGKIPVS